MKNTIAGVDLAKNAIQVCVYANKKVQSNIEMTRHEFLEWLFNTSSITVIFEACSTSNYWKQKAAVAGHAAHLISAQLVSTIRQNQKTDKNDALAIVQASLLPDITFINISFREALNAAWQHHLTIIKSIAVYDRCLEESIEQHDDCKRLLKLEGVGVINAVNLYIALGCADLGSFLKGKDASACIGLPPIQHTSGGKVKLGSIGRNVKNSLLRSQLITGAMAAVSRVCKREAVTNKDLWIQQLVARRGKKVAAVALANKTVRTAFAMLTQGTEYKAEPLAA